MTVVRPQVSTTTRLPGMIREQKMRGLLWRWTRIASCFEVEICAPCYNGGQDTTTITYFFTSLLLVYGLIHCVGYSFIVILVLAVFIAK